MPPLAEASDAAPQADTAAPTRGNASRARVRVAIEQALTAQKCRLGLLIRSVDLARPPAGSR
jgi:hypothetical protein